jgi:hypothetical protein
VYLAWKITKSIGNFNGEPFWNYYFDNREEDDRITLRWNLGTQVITIEVGFGSCPTEGAQTEFAT